MINENTGSGNEKVGLKKSKKEKKYLKKVKQMFDFLQHAFRFSLEYTFILFHCQTIACWSLECSFCPDSGLQRKRDLKMNFHSNLYLRYVCQGTSWCFCISDLICSSICMYIALIGAYLHVNLYLLDHHLQ